MFTISSTKSEIALHFSRDEGIMPSRNTGFSGHNALLSHFNSEPCLSAFVLVCVTQYPLSCLLPTIGRFEFLRVKLHFYVELCWTTLLSRPPVNMWSPLSLTGLMKMSCSWISTFGFFCQVPLWEVYSLQTVWALHGPSPGFPHPAPAQLLWGHIFQ